MVVSLEQLLEANPVVLLDGAMGTELSRRGLDLRDPLWSAKILVEAPDAVLALHLDYLAAGSDLITTASYQISEEGFEARGHSRQNARTALLDSYRLAELAVQRHAEETGDTKRAIAVSLGPYGAILADGSEYTGAYGLSHSELLRFHRARFEVLADSGASLLALETFPTMVEAEVALEALADFPTLWAWLSFVPREEPLPIQNLRSSQLVALSFNCGPVELALREASRVISASRYPVFVYPNRGGTWDPTGKAWRGDESVDATTLVRRGSALGLRGLGGCCEVGPPEIRAMRTALLR